MPELPEVEIVKEGLKKVFKPNLVIRNILFRRNDLRSILPHKKINSVLSQPIGSVERRAKYIVIEVGDRDMIVSHLGMTGTWRLDTQAESLELHDHIVMELSDGRFLIYNDPRRFGMFDILTHEQYLQDKRFSQLGPEPLSESFNVDYFWEKSRNKKVPVKSFIMDQRVVVGVGNIYACEALFEAQISPFVVAGRLRREQLEVLIRCIQNILKQSIKAGGSTISDFAQIDSSQGSYQNNHLVYGREGEACPKCSAAISVKVISGRSTFWCVKCQKTLRKTSNERGKKHLQRKNISTSARAARSRRKHTQT